MKNTLTWDMKPITFPKINSNLLSVISLIVLLTMTFHTMAVIAAYDPCAYDPCAIERKAVTNAENDVKIAGGYLLAAHASLVAAMIAQQWWLVAGLVAAKALAVLNAANQAEKLETARQALDRCIRSHKESNKNKPIVHSGQCNSGQCNSGQCNSSQNT